MYVESFENIYNKISLHCFFSFFQTDAGETLTLVFVDLTLTDVIKEKSCKNSTNLL